MATTSAVAAACEAIVRLLAASYEQAELGDDSLEFHVYTMEDFKAPMAQGVSLMLYRITQNGAQRRAPGRVLPDGDRLPPPLTIDLHILLTAWARRASLQHEIAGWMVRVLESQPTLSATMLNAYAPDVFHRSESVDLLMTQLSVEETFRIWEAIAGRSYQLSVPYVARLVRIDAPPLRALPPVEERAFDYHVPAGMP